jgi:hypothetical protein
MDRLCRGLAFGRVNARLHLRAPKSIFVYTCDCSCVKDIIRQLKLLETIGWVMNCSAEHNGPEA